MNRYEEVPVSDDDLGHRASRKVAQTPKDLWGVGLYFQEERSPYMPLPITGTASPVVNIPTRHSECMDFYPTISSPRACHLHHSLMNTL